MLLLDPSHNCAKGFIHKPLVKMQMHCINIASATRGYIL